MEFFLDLLEFIRIVLEFLLLLLQIPSFLSFTKLIYSMQTYIYDVAQHVGKHRLLLKIFYHFECLIKLFQLKLLILLREFFDVL